jgi:hypothetical protein
VGEEVELLSEAFYYFAWRFRELLTRFPKVDPIVQTKSGAEIVKVVSGLTGAVASSEAAAPPRET